MRHDRMSTSRPPGRLARVRDEAEPPAPSIAREHDRYRTRPASERARGGAPPRALCRDPAPRRPASACVRAARGCGRRSPGAAPRRRPRRRSGTLVARARRLTQLLLAEDPDEEEDRAEREPREDDRKRTRRADGGEADRRPRRGVARPEASRRLHEQAREDEAAERDDCSEHPVAGGERERADGQRYEAETERRERRHDPEQARLDSVERQGARFGGGYRMATARAEACSDRERVGAAGARLLHGCAVPGPAQSESGGGALRGSCQALREPSGSLRRPSPWSASRTDAASDHSFAEPVTLSSTAPADLSPWPCGLLVRPSGSVSTYSRPVLGASGTLGRCKWVFKTSGEAESAICEVFNFPHFHSRSCSLWKKPEKRLRARSTRSRVRSAPRARRT